ncbi:MAG: DUF2066 domain-containing protein [Alphaproteobacteria bacterium]|nr:DUF2066 domain-containing protein [Alphaproteobacteria bacterium]
MAILNNSLSYKHSRLCRTVFCVAFLLVLWSGTAVQAQEVVPLETPPTEGVAAADPYTVENIEVDITADNAVEAREKAFEAAQIKGYEELAKRILGEEEFKDFVTPDINTISSLVRDYEVTNEKLSAVRYNGVYKIRYSKKAFRKTPPQTDIDGIKQVVQKGDTLVLPFYQYGDRSFLWQANPFMNAWVRARNNNATGRAIVPVGDIDDITQVRDEQAQSYDSARLNVMRQRYNAKDIVILTAAPIAQTESTKTIQVSLYRALPSGPQLERQTSVTAYAGESEEDIYNRAMMESLAMLKNFSSINHVQTPLTQQESPQAESVIAAQLNFSSVREWIETKKAIERASGVAGVQVQSMSPRAAKVSIKYRGEIENLRLALSQSGVALYDPVQGQIYRISRAAPVSIY